MYSHFKIVLLALLAFLLPFNCLSQVVKFKIYATSTETFVQNKWVDDNNTASAEGLITADTIKNKIKVFVSDKILSYDMIKMYDTKNVGNSSMISFDCVDDFGDKVRVKLISFFGENKGLMSVISKSTNGTITDRIYLFKLSD